ARKGIEATMMRSRSISILTFYHFHKFHLQLPKKKAKFLHWRFKKSWGVPAPLRKYGVYQT
ncbi:MAG: hypothetical protein IIU29_07320, partial [Erysipelotrichaceae bacterium]|nr:hypothetical protein [Erysipelotrichaceae bacterium]